MNEIDALLHEKQKVSAAGRRSRATRTCRTRRSTSERTADPEGFWEEQANKLEWFKKWDKVLDWTPPHAKWFVGGKLNVSVNCVDRHIKTARRNKAALIWEGEPGDRRTLTYWDLYVEVQKFANVLKKLGVEARRSRRDLHAAHSRSRDRDARLYANRRGALGRVRRLLAESLRDRINDAKCKVLVTADGGYRRGAIVPLKRNSDKAIEGCPTIEHVVVVQRRPGAAGDEAFADMKEGRDHWWHRLMHDAARRLRAREDGRRRRPLHPLHVGHDGKAEGHRSHDRRISRRASPRRRSSSSISRTTTSSGAPPTSAGSPVTRISSTDRWPTARPA